MRKSALTILAISLLFCVGGLAFVLSASSAYSNTNFKSLFYMFNSQAVKVIAGIFCLFLFLFIPYEFYKRISKALMFLVTFLLIYTIWQSRAINGSERWINLGLFTFQPSEVARLFLIIHIAALIEKKGELVQSLKDGFIYIFFWVAVISLLIFIQPNVSNAIIIIILSLSILFVGGAKVKHIFVTTVGSILIILPFALTFGHVAKRLGGFVRSILYGDKINEQVTEALYALGSGGWFGQGLGNSKQSNLFLPEAYGDFIFAIIGEELGFAGTLIILVGYFLIFFFGLVIAKNARDTFGQLLAFGISFSILLNAFINATVTTGMLPTTGIPLPLISYGGTSIIITCVSIGILMNIAIMNAKFSKQKIDLQLEHAEEQV